MHFCAIRRVGQSRPDRLVIGAAPQLFTHFRSRGSVVSCDLKYRTALKFNRKSEIPPRAKTGSPLPCPSGTRWAICLAAGFAPPLSAVEAGSGLTAPVGQL